MRRLVATAVLVGCGGAAPAPAPPPPTSPPITPSQELARLADRACACPDDACARAVENEVAVWQRDHGNPRADPAKESADDVRLFACLHERGPNFVVAHPSPQTRPAANVEITAYADRACACRDEVCGTEVANGFAEWLRANPHAPGDEDEARKDGERMYACLVAAHADVSDLMKAASEVSNP